MKTITIQLSQKDAADLISAKIPNRITAKILHAMRGTEVKKRKVKDAQTVPATSVG
jgi:hypothetical protein